MSCVIGVSLQDREATIQLLQEHHAREFMGQRDLPQRKNLPGLRPRRRRPSVSRTDREQQILRVVRLVILQEIRDLFRRQLFAASSPATPAPAVCDRLFSQPASAAPLPTPARSHRTPHSATIASGTRQSAPGSQGCASSRSTQCAASPLRRPLLGVCPILSLLLGSGGTFLRWSLR